MKLISTCTWAFNKFFYHEFRALVGSGRVITIATWNYSIWNKCTAGVVIPVIVFDNECENSLQNKLKPLFLNYMSQNERYSIMVTLLSYS